MKSLSIEDLYQKWPDKKLSYIFRSLKYSFQNIIEDENTNNCCNINNLFDHCFIKLCNMIIINDNTKQSDSISKVLSSVRDYSKDNYVQCIASLLSMLMHYTIKLNDGKIKLINQRRRGNPYSSYPSSPNVSRYACQLTSKNIINIPKGYSINSVDDIESFLQKYFNFKIIDLSMESGQLLVEVVFYSVSIVKQNVQCYNSSIKNTLLHSLLDRLANYCLWGFDRNKLALAATNTVIKLAGIECANKAIILKNLKQTNILNFDISEYEKCFDGVINNPPWGEALSKSEREDIKKNFTLSGKNIDTYVPFVEAALKLLKKNGCFSFIIPNQFLSNNNTSALRKYLINSWNINNLILLPKEAFNTATIRGLILSGDSKNVDSVRLINFPMKGTTDVPIIKKEISVNDFNALKGSSWWKLFYNIPVLIIKSDTVPLQDVAEVNNGLRKLDSERLLEKDNKKLEILKSKNGKEFNKDYYPLIYGKQVQKYRLKDYKEIIRVDENLTWFNNYTKIYQKSRILVRETLKRDGHINAAYTTKELFPVYGVMTIIPKHIDLFVLLAILNSNLIARYNVASNGTFSKADFQKISIEQLRNIPIPKKAININVHNLGSDALLEQRLSIYELINGIIDKTINKNTVFLEIDLIENIVKQLYN